MDLKLAVGDEAPDFDLTSTEGVVLMLRDEVPRSSVLLYFFADPADKRVREDLSALARHCERLMKGNIKILAISPAKLDELNALQRELHLLFPLLVDDRGFRKAYGVDLEPEEEGKARQPGLFLVDRRQTVRWSANPLAEVEDALGQIEKMAETLPSSTSGYPRSVVNGWVDRWAN